MFETARMPGARSNSRLFAVGALTVSLACFLLVGCGDSGGHDHDHDDETFQHDHVHSSLYGGTLVELGDHFANLEILADADTGTLTIYTLDSHAESRVPIDQSEIRVQVTTAGGELSLSLEGVENAFAEDRSKFAEFRVESDKLRGLQRFPVRVLGVTVMGQNFENVQADVPAEK